MTNTKMFNDYMRAAGFSYSSLARRMGITDATLRGKVANHANYSSFTVSERFFIRTLFDLTKEEEKKIFG